MSIRKIILDTDPGGDDCFACLWLLSFVKRGLAELIAVTAAAGNVSAQQTFSSASQLLGLLGFHHIPIGRGTPTATPGEDASHIHGLDGMGNLSHTLPAPTHSFETATDSSDLIIDQLNGAPGDITIVAIGPLTNLAAAELKQPGILKKAKEVVVMAGAFQCPGNVTAQAEFNVWFNPEAAHVVFDSRDDTVVIPLDVTRHLIFTQAMAQAVVQGHSEAPIAKFLTALCEFMVGTTLTYREAGGTPGFLVHDAATIGYLFYPETLQFRRAVVWIETMGHWTRGQTIIDHRPVPKMRTNAWVAMGVNGEQFFTNFVEDLKTLW